MPQNNPFDEYFQTTPAQPQMAAPEPVSAPAASNAGDNPFSSFFPAQGQTPASPTAQTSAPAPAQSYNNPFEEFFPRPDSKIQEAPTGEQPETQEQKLGKPVPSYEDRSGTGESILTRPISTYFGIPEFREGAGGIEKGVEKFVSSLTSPVSLALMLATAGTSSIATAGEAALAEAAEAGFAGEGVASAETFGSNVLNWVSQKFGAEEAAQVGKWAGTIDKVATGGFALDQIRGFMAQVPMIQSDIKTGDWDAAEEHITTAGLGLVFAAASVNHLVTKLGASKYNHTPDIDAYNLQHSEIEQGKLRANKMEDQYQPVLEKYAQEVTKATGFEVTPHDLDVAMKWYHEAGGLKNEAEPRPEGSPNTLENLRDFKEQVQNLDNISPKDKAQQLRNIEIALGLPRELRDMAEEFRPFYDQHWEKAKSAGLVHPDAEARENYAGNRQYNPEDETQNAFRPSEGTLRATKKPGQLKTRRFDNMVDALKKGYVPKQIGMVEAASNYERSMGAAHGIVQAENELIRHDDTDGRPVAIEPSRIRNIPQTIESGRTVARRGIRFDDTSAIDPDSDHIIYHEGKPYLDVTDYVEGPKTFGRFRVTDVGFAKGPDGGVLLDGEGNPVELPVRKKTALMFHPDHIERVNQTFDDSSWVRRTPWMNSVLGASQFAKKTLLSLSPFHYATEALRGLQTGLSLHEIFHPEEIDPAGLAATKGTAHGLVLLGDHIERSSYRAAADSEASGGGLIGKIPYLKDIQSKAEDHLFGNWLPRLKSVAFEKMAGDLREQNPNWSEHQTYTTAARLTNATFGGLNWKALGVSANTVDFLRMLALAPDFSGSQIDFTMSAFKPGGSIVARSFARMAMYNMLVAQATNLLLHGQLHMDHPFGVVSPDEKKVWGMRTMPEDVWNSLNDPKSFVRNRLNPLVKTGVDVLYGRNDQGKKMSDTQLIGDAIRNVSPISLQGGGSQFLKYFVPDISRKFQTGSQEDDFATSIARGFGVSPSANRTAAEKLASQRLNDRLPAGISDPSQVERHHKVLDAADQIRSGHSVDLHEFTPTERRQVLTMGREDILRAKGGRLNIGDFLDVWNVSTEEEKQKLLPDLLKKSRSYVQKLSPSERGSDENYHRLKSMGLTR